ncbi:MAG: hypothetical protein H0X51_04160 [Parachlamydiaceae bacterium]|nr:hypothetical protein [Parachlamydiaceae bacterium]
MPINYEPLGEKSSVVPKDPGAKFASDVDQQLSIITNSSDSSAKNKAYQTLLQLCTSEQAKSSPLLADIPKRLPKELANSFSTDLMVMAIKGPVKGEESKRTPEPLRDRVKSSEPKVGAGAAKAGPVVGAGAAGLEGRANRKKAEFDGVAYPGWEKPVDGVGSDDPRLAKWRYIRDKQHEFLDARGKCDSAKKSAKGCVDRMQAMKQMFAKLQQADKEFNSADPSKLSEKDLNDMVKSGEKLYSDAMDLGLK